MNRQQPTHQTADFWKCKLAAFLHDPPSKCLDIPTHRERSVAAMMRAGFAEDEAKRYDSKADATAAAADRVPFPASRAGGLTCVFDGGRSRFRHPLGGEHQLGFKPIATVDVGEELEQHAQPGNLDFPADFDPGELWRARFFAHWRLWRRNLVQQDFRFDFLPADTRIPDHTIWTHTAVVAALAGCQGRPAFLKFQLGPVQEFIAAARSTRDLWSGSYLLAWLMATGMKALALEVGPDAVLFPNLHSQPLFDLQLRHELWGRIRHDGAKDVWTGFDHDPRDLLTPNLPNVFLALVPAPRAAELGRHVEAAILAEWHRIANAVWRFCAEAAPTEDGTHLLADEGALTRALREQRFRAQASRLLTPAWVATPWPESLQAAAGEFSRRSCGLPVGKAWQHIAAVQRMAEEQMPRQHCDRRYFGDGRQEISDGKRELNNLGLAWGAIYAQVSAQLDAVRQTRDFAAWASGSETPGAANNKDALNGREEAVAGGREWQSRCRKMGGAWPMLFRKSDWVGASTLIRRLWHLAFLEGERDDDGSRGWGFRRGDFCMPSVPDIAARNPEADGDEQPDPEEIPDSDKHFAVLALDGDQIGQWISGEKTPVFRDQLAAYEDSSGNPSGALAYFTQDSDPDQRGQTLRDRYVAFLDTPRPLSPSYHLQFSQALSNFALRCARPIVEAHKGRLIYAGGDDVLALLPADAAVACSEDLRAAFRGALPPNAAAHAGLAANNAGFLICTPREGADAERERQRLRDAGLLDQNGRPVPFIVPGPRTEVSVGIAMAHFKAPLQDVVRAAWEAEKRAKSQKHGKGGLGRGAVAITLFKRSGEILEWGAKWDDGGLPLFRALLEAQKADQLSAKFPHRLIEILEPYRGVSAQADGESVNDAKGFAEVCDAIIAREFDHVLGRQHGRQWPGEDLATKLREALTRYLAALSKPDPNNPRLPPQTRLARLCGLCAAVAFARRTSADSGS